MRQRPSRIIGLWAALQLVVGMTVVPPAMSLPVSGASQHTHAANHASSHHAHDGTRLAPAGEDQRVPCDTPCCDRCPACCAAVTAPQAAVRPAPLTVTADRHDVPELASQHAPRAPSLRLPFALAPPVVRG